MPARPKPGLSKATTMIIRPATDVGITGPMTRRTAVMTLFDQGKFKLDDPLKKFIPAFTGEGRERVTIGNLLTQYEASLAAYNRLQRWRWGTPFPHMHGRAEPTPKETLDLRPGEFVQVKSHDEILATVNAKNRNRGLTFDAEMVPYCGGVYRVGSRVTQIIDEPTGKMVRMKSDCIILDGVICTSKYSHKRLFCPRSIPPFWREVWLRRVDGDVAEGVAKKDVSAGEVTDRSDERSSHERPPHSS